MCFLYGLQKVRENEGELDKHRQLSQRKEEEVNDLNSQLETKRSEADQQQQELSRLKQDNVSTLGPNYNECSGFHIQRVHWVPHTPSTVCSVYGESRDAEEELLVVSEFSF